jgi:hypothetical protein
MNRLFIITIATAIVGAIAWAVLRQPQPINPATDPLTGEPRACCEKPASRASLLTGQKPDAPR